MALLRPPKYCFYCREKLKENHEDQSGLPSYLRIIGDSFLGYKECDCKKLERGNNYTGNKFKFWDHAENID